MRRWTTAAMLAAALGGAAALAPAASAASPGVAPDSGLPAAQYRGDRHDHRDAYWHGRMHDRARIAEAARREARRIEAERARRWAWRHGHHHDRHAFGHGHFPHRVW